MDKKGGYIALARSFIKDIRFRRPANRPLTELEAMIWLICEVAWRPRALPTRFGAVHNDRGQLSTTERELAGQWNWSKSKVRRFLLELKQEGTVSVTLSRPGPKIGAEPEAMRGYPRTLISLRNYETFQGKVGQKSRNGKQRSWQDPHLNEPRLPGLIYAIAASKKENQKTIYSKRAGGRVIAQKAPATGKVWNGRVWLASDDDRYGDRAAEYNGRAGRIRMPDKYLDGEGNWFTAIVEDYERLKRA